jgi:heat-inducible transcriptional repressor
MEQTLPRRQHQILLALIQEYISTAEPVGSATLVHKCGIEASPATIRSEMARLESDGYLYQPHTSSGRAPTNRAYRYYVDFLLDMQISPPTDVQNALVEYEHYNASVQRLLEFSSKHLAGMTRFTSLVLAPRLRRTMFKYLRLVHAGENNLILILMTNTGAIINKLIQMDQPMSDESLDRMTGVLNERLKGMYLGDIQIDFLQNLEPELQKEILVNLGELALETASQEETDVICDGTANLLDIPEFRDLEKLKNILGLLDDEKLVAEILKKTIASEGVKVYIGSEHQVPEAAQCAFITAPYEIQGIPVGSVGIMGPTRMPYKRLIPLIRAFARVFGRKLDNTNKS